MHPDYHRATFFTAAHRLDQLPDDSGLEVAFAGRSNAGKSSALNSLTGQKALARTSKTPGRTQQINLFALDPERRIADLPGYGYAKVPPKLRLHWERTLGSYLASRQSLRGIVLIADIRRGLTDLDRQLVGWCGEQARPLHVVLTKADKISRNEASTTLQKVGKELNQLAPGATTQTFSALKRSGIETLVETLDAWFELTPPATGP